MNDVQLRWFNKGIIVQHERGDCEYTTFKKVLQYRKFYNRAVYAAGSNCGFLLGGIEDWGWSDWMDVPEAHE